MGKTVLVISIVTLLIIAAAISGAFSVKGTTDKDIQKNVKYVMDKRTKVCFAVSGTNGICGPIYTAVDCDKVSDALANGWSR